MNDTDSIAHGDARRGWGTRRYLYVIALMSIAMGTFGAEWGLAAAGGMVVAQALVAQQSHVVLKLFVASGACLLALLLLPTVQAVRVHSPVTSSFNNLKHLALACFNHDDVHGTWPRPYTTNSDGKPLHSWRTSLLPFIEEQDLFASIEPNEPWNSDANKQALQPHTDDVCWLFHSPRFRTDVESQLTQPNYFAVVGDETVWPPEGTITPEDVTDDPGKTIVLIEAATRGRPWFEPKDLTVDEAIDLLVGETREQYEHVEPGFFFTTVIRGGLYPRLVAFADGHVERIGYFRSRDMARAFLTRSGGEETAEAHEVATSLGPPSAETVSYRVHWLRVGAVTLFAVLSIAPVFASGRRVLFGRS